MLKKSYLDYVFLDFWAFYLAKSVSVLMFLLGLFFSVLGMKKKAVTLFLASVRYSYLSWSSTFLFKKFRTYDYLPLASRPATSEDARRRAIVLSCPKIDGDNCIKKGVILITFSHTFSYFILNEQWGILNKYFAFVLEPSWAGYADPDILAFAQKTECCVIQAAEINDRIFLNRMFPQVPCEDTGASNWIDSDFFIKPKGYGVEKEFDSVYVANLNPIKRVYRAIDIAGKAVIKNKNYKI